ncbi:MAG: hypothetical protein ACK56I_07685, partial [bacterium]
LRLTRREHVRSVHLAHGVEGGGVGRDRAHDRVGRDARPVLVGWAAATRGEREQRQRSAQQAASEGELLRRHGGSWASSRFPSTDLRPCRSWPANSNAHATKDHPLATVAAPRNSGLWRRLGGSRRGEALGAP